MLEHHDHKKLTLPTLNGRERERGAAAGTEQLYATCYIQKKQQKTLCKMLTRDYILKMLNIEICLNQQI